MIRAYKFLLRPTARQTAVLGQMLRDHCSLYNGALQERRDAYRHTSKTTVRDGDQSAQLKEIRVFDPERQGRWAFSSQQATPRRLDKAFKAFFRRVKAGQSPGYPRFKGVGHFDTVTFPKGGDGCRWDSTPHDARARVRLQGVGHVRVRQHRPVRGRVKTISVKREGTRWYVVLSCDSVPAEPLLPTGAMVGIDTGVAHFLTTSDGEHVANPRFLTAMAAELGEAQRHLATFPKRTRQRTKRHRSAARKVAKLHARIRRAGLVLCAAAWPPTQEARASTQGWSHVLERNLTAWTSCFSIRPTVCVPPCSPPPSDCARRATRCGPPTCSTAGCTTPWRRAGRTRTRSEWTSC
ncbi:putative transposase [Streptomyces wuyuanensis]|uniref:Putative transposase n=1 Tax=Streptomyces wuyuanensis TaxID=1196353 RepID=A0A1G9QUB5_9ACTN|nr:putative transposase [Streptomyces wuyuanensis]